MHREKSAAVVTMFPVERTGQPEESLPQDAVFESFDKSLVLDPEHSEIKKKKKKNQVAKTLPTKTKAVAVATGSPPPTRRSRAESFDRLAQPVQPLPEPIPGSPGGVAVNLIGAKTVLNMERIERLAAPQVRYDASR